MEKRGHATRRPPPRPPPLARAGRRLAPARGGALRPSLARDRRRLDRPLCRMGRARRPDLRPRHRRPRRRPGRAAARRRDAQPRLRPRPRPAILPDLALRPGGRHRPGHDVGGADVGGAALDPRPPVPWRRRRPRLRGARHGRLDQPRRPDGLGRRRPRPDHAGRGRWASSRRRATASRSAPTRKPWTATTRPMLQAPPGSIASAASARVWASRSPTGARPAGASASPRRSDHGDPAHQPSVPGAPFTVPRRLGVTQPP